MGKRYDYLKKQSVQMGEANDCTVKALALVSGMEYKYCHTLLAKHGRPRRSGPSWAQFYRAVSAMGLWKKEYQVKSKTLTTLERELKNVKGRFLVETSGGRHVCAIVNGVVEDWTAGRRHRVLRVWKVSW